MAAWIENINGGKNMSIISSILRPGPFSFLRHAAAFPDFDEVIVSDSSSCCQCSLKGLCKRQLCFTWYCRWLGSRDRSKNCRFCFVSFVSLLFIESGHMCQPCFMFSWLMKDILSLSSRQRILVLITPKVILPIFQDHVEFFLIVNLFEMPLFKFV